MNPHGRRAAKAQTPPGAPAESTHSSPVFDFARLFISDAGELRKRRAACLETARERKEAADVYCSGANKAVLRVVRGRARVKLQADRFWQLMFR